MRGFCLAVLSLAHAGPGLGSRRPQRWGVVSQPGSAGVDGGSREGLGWKQPRGLRSRRRSGRCSWRRTSRGGKSAESLGFSVLLALGGLRRTEGSFQFVACRSATLLGRTVLVRQQAAASVQASTERSVKECSTEVGRVERPAWRVGRVGTSASHSVPQSALS